ncbi:MAG TPA: RICIN domain-containing protein, partial [Polyangia bacterium]|nr:RICIN domain-containing protein [Polyangia bacterium]
NSYTPVFDTSYIYRISPLPSNGGQSLDVYNGSTAIGTAVQQYSSWDGIPQKFTLVPDGTNWRIAMTIDLSKCIDLVGSGSATGNGTRLQVAACTAGDKSQQWTISADAMSGAFYLKNVQAGRCLDENGGNTSPGLPLQIWDCNNGANQKWNINAYPSN